MAERPRGMELIVAGDLNVDLEKAGGQGQDEEIATSVATEVLEDLAGYFLPRRRAWINDWRTWAVVRQGGGSEVPDGIHPGIQPPDLSERGRLGSEAQL